MLIRLRSRDGMERVTVADNASVGQLIWEISTKLGIAAEDITLSRNPGLLISKDPTQYSDMSNLNLQLASLRIQNGELVHMFYPYDRQIVSERKLSPFERSFGHHMTVQELIAQQTRIERQEAPHCTSLSFNRHAANAFQQYVMAAHAFSIKRGGILYGTVQEGGEVLVEAIYEPPQEGAAQQLQLQRGTEEEQRADLIASLLGWQKVGWIFTQAKQSQSEEDKDVILSAEEVMQMAALQAELGDRAATGVVSVSSSEAENGASSDVQFEAFQVSDQAVKLFQEGWFQTPENPKSGKCVLRNPKEPKKKDPVIVAGKDVGEVDNNYFLVPVKILDHDGQLTTSFPIENRLVPQGASELKKHLQQNRAKPYVQRLSDFHLLLYLSKQPNFDIATDISFLVKCVHAQSPVPEGYTLIIDSLAET